ncbi:hypothetical protein [Undibacterium sp. TC9W]|uniref:hypothetical protein n=1 Tax=Undibacterium sp. TC9W TaxID=3413053 RepID=UPI003BEFB0B5
MTWSTIAGWSEGEIFFQAYKEQAPGTVPIYSHFSADSDRFYYDTNKEDNAGWAEGDIIF